ncbi:MAG: DUF4834 family protein [Mediterranea sp.]|jgi:hypothetical protein|nr:DUF4834 family protein [Mediterranea sp.]
MHILLFFLLLIVLIVSLGVSIIGFLVRTLFGLGRKPYSRSATANPGQSRDDRTQPPSHPRKIFGKDEGEYVDFEEINH